MRYFKEHFPRGDQHAGLLWERWRCALVKEERPGPGVAISHGQPYAHWQIVHPGGIFINLESMWDDFEQSVESLIMLLSRDPARRQKAVDWWAKRTFSVQRVALPSPATTHSAISMTAASFATSMTVASFSANPRQPPPIS